jgi:hypothetical protein
LRTASAKHARDQQSFPGVVKAGRVGMAIDARRGAQKAGFSGINAVA